MTVNSVVDGLKPSMFMHCEAVYDKMRAEAREVFEDDVPFVVWEGYLTKLVKSLNMPSPYYSAIRNALTDMGCIKQLRRGGGNSKSQWEMIKPPVLDAYQELPDPTAKRGVEASDMAYLKQRVADQATRIDRLESNVETLVKLYNEKFSA
jgi:hypothetical protein